jgi:hypothetical protein
MSVKKLQVDWIKRLIERCHAELVEALAGKAFTRRTSTGLSVTPILF